MLESKQCRMESYKEPSAPENPVEPNFVYKNAKQPKSVSSAQPAKNQNQFKKKSKNQNQDSVAQTAAVNSNAPAQSNWRSGGAQSSDAASGAQNFNPAFVRNKETDILCWNCNRRGHAFRFCPSGKVNLFCWSCGEPNFTSYNCPNKQRHRPKNAYRAPAQLGTSQGRPEKSADEEANTGNRFW